MQSQMCEGAFISLCFLCQKMRCPINQTLFSPSTLHPPPHSPTCTFRVHRGCLWFAVVRWPWEAQWTWTELQIHLHTKDTLAQLRTAHLGKEDGRRLTLLLLENVEWLQQLMLGAFYHTQPGFTLILKRPEAVKKSEKSEGTKSMGYMMQMGGHAAKNN